MKDSAQPGMPMLNLAQLILNGIQNLALDLYLFDCLLNMHTICLKKYIFFKNKAIHI